MKRRVVITGTGSVSSLGIGSQNLWKSIRTGKCGISTIERIDTSNLPVKIGAGINTFDIRYINAHGTSTKANDKGETAAVKAVFDKHAYDLYISSTKSMTGHLLGASGAIEAIITSFALKEGFLPPTINYKTPDPECDLNYVPNIGKEANFTYALSNSFGFGGHNASLVLKHIK